MKVSFPNSVWERDLFIYSLNLRAKPEQSSGQSPIFHYSLFIFHCIYSGSGVGSVDEGVDVEVGGAPVDVGVTVNVGVGVGVSVGGVVAVTVGDAVFVGRGVTVDAGIFVAVGLG